MSGLVPMANLQRMGQEFDAHDLLAGTTNDGRGELIEGLRAGTQSMGMEGDIQLYDINGADELMFDAADWIAAAPDLAAENARQANTIMEMAFEARAKDAELTALREAATELLAAKSSTFRARNGRDVGIEADDGEKCWIVHSDHIFALETALARAKSVS